MLNFNNKRKYCLYSIFVTRWIIYVAILNAIKICAARLVDSSTEMTRRDEDKHEDKNHRCYF